MARKKTPRGLPLLPRIAMISATADESARVLDVLRRVALTNQGDEAQSFYPVREVAGRFRVPISTVVRVYAQLEKEGLLNRIRGSKTILQGRAGAHRLMVRGVIAMPARLSSFMALQDYRMFFMQARREFWKRGFVTTNVFFEADHSDVLVERIRHGDVETALWYLPDVHAKEAILRLGDTGIQVIGVSDGEWPAIPCQYQIRREAAIRTILHEWQSQSVRSIKILRVGQKLVLREARLEVLLNETKIAFEFIAVTSQSVETFFYSAYLDQVTAVMLPAASASMLSFRAPELLARLLETSRVAFIDGLVSIPFAEAPDAKVDLVAVDWEQVTKHIASNLITREVHFVEPTIFEAKAYLRVPLCEYAQSI